MTEETEVAPMSVAQMYREGLHYSALAVDLAARSGLQEAATYAAIAHARFAGVQAAAFAVAAISEADENVKTDALKSTMDSWRQIFEMSGGR